MILCSCNKWYVSPNNNTSFEFLSNKDRCLQATTPDWHNSIAFIIFFSNVYPLLHEFAYIIYTFQMHNRFTKVFFLFKMSFYFAITKLSNLDNLVMAKQICTHFLQCLLGEISEFNIHGTTLCTTIQRAMYILTI